MLTLADFPDKATYLAKFIEALRDGSGSPRVQEMFALLTEKPEWFDDAKRLLDGRIRVEKELNVPPIGRIGAQSTPPPSTESPPRPEPPKETAKPIDWSAMLGTLFGWTKNVVPFFMHRGVLTTLIGILTVGLGYFGVIRTPPTDPSSPQFISKNVGDKLTEELRLKLVKDIDTIVKTKDFRDAVEKAIADAKTASDKK